MSAVGLPRPKAEKPDTEGMGDCSTVGDAPSSQSRVLKPSWLRKGL